MQMDAITCNKDKSLRNKNQMNEQMKESWNVDELMDERIFHQLMQSAQLTMLIFMKMWIGSWMGQFQDWERTSEQGAGYGIFRRLLFINGKENNSLHKRLHQLLLHYTVASDSQSHFTMLSSKKYRT